MPLHSRSPRTFWLVTTLTLLSVGMVYLVGAEATAAGALLRDISTAAGFDLSATTAAWTGGE